MISKMAWCICGCPTAQSRDPLTPQPQVSKNWTRRFLACNPEFYKRKQRPLAIECKNAHDEDDFMEYLRSTRTFGLKKGLSMRMYGIRMRLGFAQAVVGRIGS